MTPILLTLVMAQSPAAPPVAPVLVANGWKAGPLPAGTWGWGGVVLAGSDPTNGFFFADFQGTKVVAIGGGGRGSNRTLTADQVGWFNNCLTVPQKAAASTPPMFDPKAAQSGITYAEAHSLARTGAGRSTWRFILAIGVPAGDPAVFYGAAVYALKGDPPPGVKPGHYQVAADDTGRAVWLAPGTATWAPMPPCPDCPPQAKTTVTVTTPTAQVAVATAGAYSGPTRGFFRGEFRGKIKQVLRTRPRPFRGGY